VIEDGQKLYLNNLKIMCLPLSIIPLKRIPEHPLKIFKRRLSWERGRWLQSFRPYMWIRAWWRPLKLNYNLGRKSLKLLQWNFIKLALQPQKLKKRLL
jgi:hypothetical protein